MKRLAGACRRVIVGAVGAGGQVTWKGKVWGVALLCTGAAVGANGWIKRYADPFIKESVAQVPRQQVAIVPGARVYPDGTPSATLEDRLAAAWDLYRARKVSKILVSGDHRAPEYDEVRAMWRWLDARGVPAQDVFLDHAGLRTLDTMIRAREVFQVTSAVICTQRFHLPRAVFLARRAGIDAVGIAADRRVYAGRRKNRMREFAARSVSFADSYFLGTGPRFGGEPIPITGDGRQTH